MNRTRAVLLAMLAAFVFALASTTYAQIAPVPLPAALSPTKIPQFAQALPVLLKDIPVVDGTQSVQINMCEYEQSVLPPKTPIVAKPGITLGKTVVWGYQAGTAGCKAPDAVPGSYIGPVIVAQRGTPTQVTYQNNLGTSSGTQVLAYQQSTDQTLVWADPLGTTSDIAATNIPEQNACANWVKTNPGVLPPGNCGKHYDGYIAAAPHLHGGEIPAMLDGGPDAWWTKTGIKGHGYYSMGGAATGQAIYRYPNGQEAAPIWFHDHTLGATRLNVYAGIAGSYMIIDPAASLPGGMTALGLENGARVAAGGVATDELLIPIVIQDRMFDVNGQLLFPNLGINPDHPFWIPEFVGDTIVVNGKAWPYHKVEPKRYRFLFLNGSNARTYELFLINKTTGVKGPAMYVIGTDQGYLDAPAKIDPNVKPSNVLVMMPGERYEVIIDFAGFAGARLLLANSGKTPYPAGAPPAGGTVGRIMEFRVGTCTSGFCGASDLSYNPAAPTTAAAPIRMANPIQRLADPLTGMSVTGITIDKVRQLTLNEVIAKGGPVEILVNNTPYLGMSRVDFTGLTTASGTTYYSELPNEGETELWEIVNLTADAHPIHPHLVGFQLVNRQAFDVKGYNAAYAAAFGGAYVPSGGPPADYNTCPVTAPNPARPTCVGGNPDVTPFLAPGVIPPKPSEAGWKDTVMALPGQVTRFLVRFAPADLPATATSADPGAAYAFNPDGGHGYVWHCHIIDHEDNEMMRPFSVVSRTDICDPYLLPAEGVCTTAARSFVREKDY